MATLLATGLLFISLIGFASALYAVKYPVDVEMWGMDKELIEIKPSKMAYNAIICFVLASIGMIINSRQFGVVPNDRTVANQLTIATVVFTVVMAVPIGYHAWYYWTHRDVYTAQKIKKMQERVVDTNKRMPTDTGSASTATP